MRKTESMSGDLSGISVGPTSTRRIPDPRVDPNDIKQAIRLLRAVESSEYSNMSNLHVSQTLSVGDGDWKSASYSEQRSIILDDFHRLERPRNRARSVAMGSSSHTARSTTPSQHYPRRRARSRPIVQRDTITTPDFENPSVHEIVRSFQTHFVSINRKIRDIFTADSYSLIELFEILMSLEVPNVSESDIDDLLLFISFDTYWEKGYFEDVSTKKLIELFS
jgi:hypothetical protein